MYSFIDILRVVAWPMASIIMVWMVARVGYDILEGRER